MFFMQPLLGKIVETHSIGYFNASMSTVIFQIHGTLIANVDVAAGDDGRSLKNKAAFLFLCL